MSLVIIVLILVLICGGFGYARQDFAWPGGVLGTILLVLVILLLLGRI